MNDLALQCSASGNASTSGFERILSGPVLELAGKTIVCSYSIKSIIVELRNDGLLGFAQSRGRFDKRSQHGIQVECRAADHLEHIGGRGLLLQRLAQLIEQSRIFDRDDGLRGEVREQTRFAYR